MLSCLVESIKKNKLPFVIYGAGQMGQKLGEYLCDEGLKPAFFCVTENVANENWINGIFLTNFKEIKKPENYLFIVAAKSANGGRGIFDNLIKNDIHHVLLLTDRDYIELNEWQKRKVATEWGRTHDAVYQTEGNYADVDYLVFGGNRQLRFRKRINYLYVKESKENCDLRRIFESQYGNVDYLASKTECLPEKIDFLPNSHFFSIRSIHDNTIYEKMPEWVIPIQAGAILSEKKIADVTDDTGDNISERNKDYSETTAFY